MHQRGTKALVRFSQALVRFSQALVRFSQATRALFPRPGRVFICPIFLSARPSFRANFLYRGTQENEWQARRLQDASLIRETTHAGGPTTCFIHRFGHFIDTTTSKFSPTLFSETFRPRRGPRLPLEVPQKDPPPRQLLQPNHHFSLTNSIL
jgi:hypothetical protein